MSPLISPLPAAGNSWVTPAGWSVAQFQYLCGIDMDAIVQTDVDYIDPYCTSWLKDDAPNQPIRANGTTFDPWNPRLVTPNSARRRPLGRCYFRQPAHRRFNVRRVQ